MKIKAILIPTIALFIICLGATFLLAYTNKVTEPKIADINLKMAMESRKKVLPAAASFDEKTDSALGKYFVGKDSTGNIVGYVFVEDGIDKGYGGIVKVMTGIDKSGNVSGVEPIVLNETPGLGMKASTDDFKNQFLNKKGKIAVSKASPKDDEIQAITASTITSKAFTSAVNVALEKYAQIGGTK